MKEYLFGDNSQELDKHFDLFNSLKEKKHP